MSNKRLMENVIKWIVGVVSAALALLAPIQQLVLCAMIFITVDFITGVVASRKRAVRAGTSWGFESEKAWNTVYKLVFAMVGIIMSHLIDVHILGFLNLRLANLFTGFICGVEFWSYLENAAFISNHPVFRWLRQFMKSKLEEEIGTKMDDSITEHKTDDR